MVKITAIGHKHCPHCSKAFHFVGKIKKKFPGIKIEKIDILKQPHIALKHKIFYSPSIMVNDKVVFNGIPSQEKIFAKIKSLSR